MPNPITPAQAIAQLRDLHRQMLRCHPDISADADVIAWAAAAPRNATGWIRHNGWSFAAAAAAVKEISHLVALAQQQATPGDPPGTDPFDSLSPTAPRRP